MTVDSKKYRFQPQYGDECRLSVHEISELLDRDKPTVTKTLRSLPEGAALRALDLPVPRDGGGNALPNPARTRELASAAMRLPFERWGELVRRDL